MFPYHRCLLVSLVLFCTTRGETSKLSDSANCFTLNLYKNLVKSNSGSNLICSPFSADVLLSLILTGSGGNTADQLKKALGYDNPGYSLDDIKDGFKSFLKSLVSSDGNTLKIASSAWIQDGFNVKADFADTAKNNFYTSMVDSMSFKDKPHNATNIINKWGSENTNGLIPEIFSQDLPKNTLMVLVNALYFKGYWQKKFKSSDTFPQTFYNNGNQGKNVPLMSQLQKFLYKDDSNSQVLEMDYEGGNTSMVLILPQDLRILEQNLDCKSLSETVSGLYESLVQVTIPKYTAQSDLDLIKPLKDMGIRDLFDLSGLANLSGISSGPLAVANVVQKAVIKVDEEGSEAAAVTAVRSCRSCTSIGPMKTNFRADRPFIYFIRHKPTGLILFMGRVNSL